MRLCVILAVAGCGGSKQVSVDDALAEWTPKVSAKLDAIGRIATMAPTATEAYAPTLTLVTSHPAMAGDTVITYEADLAALAAGKPAPTNADRHASSPAVVECWSAIKNRQFASFRLSDSSYFELETAPLQGFQVELLCQDLAQAHYLAVVRAIEQTHGGGAEVPDSADQSAASFSGTKATGAIDVYELPSGRALGRRRFVATSSSQVVYKTASSGVGSTVDADRAIAADFGHQLHRAIEAALAGQAPPAAPAAAPPPEPPAARGTLDPSAIRTVATRHAHEITSCYQKHGGGGAGRVVVKFTIDLHGNVSTVHGDGMADAMNACVAASVKAWRFPPPHGGPVNVSFPFVFGAK